MNRLFTIILFLLVIVGQLEAQNNRTNRRETFKISSDDVRFPVNGGSKTLTVTSSSSWNIETNPASWCRISKSGATLTLTAAQNTGMTDRNTYFVISSGSKKLSVNVSQETMGQFEVTVDNDAPLSYRGGSRTFIVNSTEYWSISAYPEAYWCNLSKSGNTLTLTAYRNTLLEERSTHFVIKSGEKEITINITQGAFEQFEISEESASFTCDGGSKTLAVTSNVSWSVVTHPDPWCAVTTNDTSLTLRAEKNPYMYGRNTEFLIVAGSDEFRFYVEQEPFEEFYITPDDVSFPSKGGSAAFTVTSTRSWYVRTIPARWCTLTRNGNELTLVANPNSQFADRRTYFVLEAGDKTIRAEILQNAQEKLEVTANDDAMLPYAGGGKTYTVTSTLPWTVSVNPDSWCTVSKNGNSLTVNAGPNPYMSKRETSFVVNSGEKSVQVNVVQQAKQIYLTATPKVNFAEYGGPSEVSVQTNADNYSISDLPSWCMFSKSEAGFKLYCEPNETAYDRKAYVVIKAEGKEFAVEVVQEANQRKKRRMENGGTFMWGINQELGIGPDNEFSSYMYDLGVGLKLGNYCSIVQFELGARLGLVSTSYEDEEYYKETSLGLRIPLYARVKMNLFRYGSGWVFASGMLDYNVVRDEDAENEYYAGGGIGYALKNFEWEVYYKCALEPSFNHYECIEYDNKFIGASLRWYW